MPSVAAFLVSLAALWTGCATAPRAPSSPAASKAAPAADEASEPAPAAPETEAPLDVETSTDAAFLDELPFDTEAAEERGDVAVAAVLTQTGTVSFDIPMVENERVAFWEDYLTGRGRSWFETWLSRSTRYVPGFRAALERRGLPEDLVFLSMVESGFSTSAQSWANAVGPWQFVESTGRAYGLRIDFWVDERRDFDRSTEAALAYLERLHARFGDWLLAFAAYNAGPGRVSRAIRRAGVEDFWALDRWLRKETENYVPKILAAARIAKQADRLGFSDVPYLPPLDHRALTTTVSVSLRSLAEACPEEVDLETLERMNPALRTGVTPPAESWTLRVPKSVTATCSSALDQAPHRSGWAYRWHRVGAGDTPKSVAGAYGTTAEAVLDFSQATAAEFERFEEIVVPIPRARAAAVPIRTPDALSGRSAVYGVPTVRIIRYRVRSGDSLWKIAQRFHVSVSDLCRWNRVSRSGILSLGQRLRIEQRPGSRRSSSSAAKVKRSGSGVHVVQPGESFWLIARRYETTVARLLELNQMDESEVLMPGDELRVR